ncbi:hypothetical protein [Chitinophaga sp. Cy-1792]|uniref:hypothetical protein n=1 Tax=Chitinophaga sp. Cy-1792 TaxID=2608339 RepID=UPI00141FCEF0|nr:hypothetical protein [Chitinophaga sp. Cy-1792]NIG53702.1 hypothetical protein [Chitinophaga sp. Cy-1792]
MITITILSLAYLAAISFRIKHVKFPVLELLTWNIHIVLMVLAALSLLLMINGYGFKGAQTDRVILTLYAASGLFLYGISKPEINARYYYLAGLFAFPFVLLIGLILPFTRTLTILVALSIYGDSDYHRYKIDDDFAIQTKSTGILTRYPVYSMVEDKYWFFEKVTPEIIDPKAAPQGIKLTKRGNDSVRIQLVTSKGGTLSVGGTHAIDTVISLKQGYLQ